MLRLPKTLIGAIGITLACVFPGAAGAATAFVTWHPPSEYLPEGGVDSITYAADPGETNEVTITSDGSGIFHISDAGAVITPGPGCTAVSLQGVECGSPPPAQGVRVPDQQLIVFAGDGNDSIDASAVRPSSPYVKAPRLYGGDGDDVLLGTEFESTGGKERLIGGPGDDVLIGGDRPEGVGDGNDLRGGPGDDRLVGGPNNDVLAGGEGTDILDGRGNPATPGSPRGDVADYGDSPGAVVVTLDDRPGDGRAGENDHIRNVESVRGSKYGDRLIGNAEANHFSGRRGGDVLLGRGGNDRLGGGHGQDILRPGGGRDTVMGWQGRDTIYARDGARDYVVGGGGRDRARIDRGLDRMRLVERLF